MKTQLNEIKRMQQLAGIINESINFNEVKDALTKAAQDHNLVLFPKPVEDPIDLLDMIKTEKGNLPKSGVIVADNFSNLNLVTILSKDQTVIDNFRKDMINQFDFSQKFNREEMGVKLSANYIAPKKA